jgi:hypothetical protein
MERTDGKGTWAFGPARKRRSRIMGAVVGFAVAASVVAVATWVIVPNSPGIGFGKGRAPVSGLALVSLNIPESDGTFGDGVGPSESGSVYARWTNPNPMQVSIIKVEATNGTITAVGDPTCVAHSPADYTTVPGTVPPGTWTVAPNNTAVRDTSLTLNTTASFPSCLAGVEFQMNVLATAVV